MVIQWTETLSVENGLKQNWRMKMTKNETAATNIVLAIVGLTVINSTFSFLFGICTNVRLTFPNAPPSPIRKPLADILRNDPNNEKTHISIPDPF